MCVLENCVKFHCICQHQPLHVLPQKDILQIFEIIVTFVKSIKYTTILKYEFKQNIQR